MGSGNRAPTPERGFGLTFDCSFVNVLKHDVVKGLRVAPLESDGVPSKGPRLEGDWDIWPMPEDVVFAQS